MKVLITGANGFIGRKILQQLAGNKDNDLLAISLHEDKFPSEGYRFCTADITDGKALTECVTDFQPDVIIHTAALSVIGYCETHQDESLKTNCEVVRHLAALSKDLHCRLIHISTDNVFDGQTAELHKENDAPNPINTYGRHKLMAEQAIQQTLENYAILRVVMVYGNPLEGQHGNLIHLVRSQLSSGEPLYAVTDQFRTATYVGDIVDVTEKLLDDKHSGIYHICSGELKSIYDIALTAASVFQLDKTLIKPINTAEQNAGFVRMAYGALCIEKARKELGFKPHLLHEALPKMIIPQNS